MEQKISKNYKDHFDQIFMLEVLEYCFDLPQVFSNINKLLKPNGILYFSTHWLYGLHNPKGEDCVRLGKNGITKLLTDTGFEIIKMIPRTISEEGRVWLERFYRAEGMRLDYSDPDTWVEGWLVEATK